MKKIAMLFILSFLFVFALAESGTVNLVYENGSVYSENEKTYYAFDVQAWISNGSDVLSDGMVYVEYPLNIFDDILVMDQKVSVEKKGILSGTDPVLGNELYQIVNVTDTRTDVFAVTFSSNFDGSNPDFKQYYESVSTDAANPSDLLHIVMEVSAEGQGDVFFPNDIPGTDNLYFDYEYETFSGGLDISAATEPVEVVFSTDPPDEPIDDPEQEGAVVLADFKSKLKKSVVELSWTSISEIDIDGYVIERAETGGDYAEIVSYVNDPSLEGETASTKRIRYAYDDKGITTGVNYDYRLSAVDIYGNVLVLDQTSVQSDNERDNFVNQGKGRKKVMELAGFTLEVSYPNPFNPQFMVPFELTDAQYIDIKLYDMSGKRVREVATGYYSAGRYNVQVNCNDLSSGVYLLKTIAGGQRSIQKMLLVK